MHCAETSVQVTRRTCERLSRSVFDDMRLFASVEFIWVFVTHLHFGLMTSRMALY